MRTWRMASLAVLLPLIGATAGCGHTGDPPSVHPGDDHAVTPSHAPSNTPSADPAEADGPGAYATPADPKSLCKLPTYAPFAVALGTPYGAVKSANLGADATSSRSARCTQNLFQQINGKADPGAANGSVETQISFWHDVALAKRQFSYGKGSDAREFAKGGQVLPQPGVGTEAYRYTRAESGGGAVILELVARKSNVQVDVRLIAGSRTPWTDEQITQLFNQMAAYTTALLPVVLKATPAA